MIACASIYAGDDKLFVPVENIEVLSRYGSEDADVPLDRLGGVAWQSRKARVKKRIKDIADELIQVAAERQLRQGETMPPPEGLYEEFAARFPYPETEDQDRAIADTLGDLASGRPMDRLVCGDVGFGKTEVALRAAFIAAMAGTQVAVVVPTTLLARQHFRTFTERFAGLPVRDRAALAPGSGQARGRDQAASSPRAASTSSSAPMRCSAKSIAVPPSRPARRRRGAAFRRGAEGAAEAAQGQCPCADADRDADPAHLAAGAGRACAR